MTDAPSTTSADVGLPEIVSPAEWRVSFETLLTKEKQLTTARDALSAARRRMPMTKVDAGYRFIGPHGEVGLLDLFEERRQLIVYRFFYACDVEGWPEGACSGCSMFADSVTHPAHLAARDTTLAFVSAAPQERIETYRDRMGWSVPWYTLVGDDFSRDFDVAEHFGLNVFVRDDEEVYRTYFVNGRGVETIGPAFTFLDLTPLGRQEHWEDAPPGRPQGDPYQWWRRHDEYAGRTRMGRSGGRRRHHFRRAERHEARQLEALQKRSTSHWDYPDGFFDWAGDAVRISESYIADNPVVVLVDDESHKLGFYSFTATEDGLLLDRMFLDVARIGEGLGRVLWRHAVQTARELGVTEFVIGADPNAAPFYEAMGARWYAAKPTEEPTWTVQMYRYTLTSQTSIGEADQRA